MGRMDVLVKARPVPRKQKTHSRFECADVSPDVKRALRRPTITCMKGYKSISKRFQQRCYSPSALLSCKDDSKSTAQNECQLKTDGNPWHMLISVLA